MVIENGLDVTLENVSVYVDKDSMSEVVRNLVRNARKVSPEGGTVILSARCIRIENREIPMLPMDDNSNDNDSHSRISDMVFQIDVKDSGDGISEVRKSI